MAAPIPLDAPVTMATLPRSFCESVDIGVFVFCVEGKLWLLVVIGASYSNCSNRRVSRWARSFKVNERFLKNRDHLSHEFLALRLETAEILIERAHDGSRASSWLRRIGFQIG